MPLHEFRNKKIIKKKKAQSRCSIALFLTIKCLALKIDITQLMGTLATRRLMAWSKPGPTCNGYSEPGLKKVHSSFIFT